MDVDSVCLKSASEVVDRDHVHDPARALEADPGLVHVPEAAPGEFYSIELCIYILTAVILHNDLGKPMYFISMRRKHL